MAYLVMLVTVLAIMHGVVHPYPRRSTNQQTNGELKCTKYDNQEVPLGSNETGIIVCSSTGQEQEPLSYGSTKRRVEFESVKTKLDRYNKKWRLPRIENEELETVFIIGTDDY